MSNVSTMSSLQHTLRGRIDLSGIGVHSGRSVSLCILPSSVDSGIVFRRTDASGCDIPAVLDSVCSTELCTIIGSNSGDDYVMTIEHLMSSLVSLGVDNAIIELDGPEVPIMDGSADSFTRAITHIGLECQASPRRFLRILREVRFEHGDSWGSFVPHFGSRFDIEIDFSDSVISRQRHVCDLTPSTFCSDLSRSRTFGFLADAERYHAAGYALGSSPENSILIGTDSQIINPDGLRYPDEFVRHKTLDAVGDISLCGAPLLGCFRSYKGGHKLNVLALRALMDTPDAWQWSDMSANPLPLRGSPLLGADIDSDIIPASAAAK